MTDKIAVNEAIIGIAARADLGGHDLTALEPVDDHDGSPNGYEARCRQCNLTVWVDDSGLRYNMLADACPGG